MDDPNLANEFALAETLHKTVAELRTGAPQPISCAEFLFWLAFNNYKRAMREMG